MIAETAAPVMLSQSSLAAIFGDQDVPVICVDEILSSGAALDATNPEPMGAATDLAYVMYTSGSTGRTERRDGGKSCGRSPGAEHEFLQLWSRGSVSAVCACLFRCFHARDLGPAAQWRHARSDAPGAASLEDLGRAIREHGVTTMWLTSGLFNLMVDQRLEDLRPIRQLLAGGDVLSSRHVRQGSR